MKLSNELKSKMQEVSDSLTNLLSSDFDGNMNYDIDAFANFTMEVQDLKAMMTKEWRAANRNDIGEKK